MRDLKEICNVNIPNSLNSLLESSLLDIDGTFEYGDKYEKDLTMFFDEINKHLKNTKEWNVKYADFTKPWVCYSFNIPMNETVLKFIEKPLKLNQGYKIENLYIDVSILWDKYNDVVKCHIELMLKNNVGSPIILRYSGKTFKPNFNTKTTDIHDNKTLINGLLKPAIKNTFKPALKSIDTLIEFMTTQFD